MLDSWPGESSKGWMAIDRDAVKESFALGGRLPKIKGPCHILDSLKILKCQSFKLHYPIAFSPGPYKTHAVIPGSERLRHPPGSQNWEAGFHQRSDPKAGLSSHVLVQRLEDIWGLRVIVNMSVWMWVCVKDVNNYWITSQLLTELWWLSGGHEGKLHLCAL